jgi:hypothetical protein
MSLNRWCLSRDFQSLILLGFFSTENKLAAIQAIEFSIVEKSPPFDQIGVKTNSLTWSEMFTDFGYLQVAPP